MRKLLFKLVALLCITASAVKAQTLPNIQKDGLYAPANVKIDGNISEWGKDLQAYNSNTDLFYTLSNDQKNLYLTVKAANVRIIEKVLEVGVNLVIDKNEKNDKSAKNFSLTYPFMDLKSIFYILSRTGIRSSKFPKGMTDTVTKKITSPQQKDSLLAVANKSLISNAKLIKVNNLTGIADSVISVYNEFGVRAAGSFDSNIAYTLEFAIPLKYIGLSITSPKFNYRIRLTNRLEDRSKHYTMAYKYVGNQTIDVNQDLDSTTDFWGTYTLVAK